MAYKITTPMGLFVQTMKDNVISEHIARNGYYPHEFSCNEALEKINSILKTVESLFLSTLQCLAGQEYNKAYLTNERLWNMWLYFAFRNDVDSNGYECKKPYTTNMDSNAVFVTAKGLRQSLTDEHRWLLAVLCDKLELNFPKTGIGDSKP